MLAKAALFKRTEINAQREVTAVTLMLFVKIPKALTSARAKQALKEMENIVKTLMSATLNTMVAVYMNVTTYQEITVALVMMDSI